MQPRIPKDVTIPGLVAELFADELAPIGGAGPGLPDSLSHDHAIAIGYALRAAAHGVAIDWPRVLDFSECARDQRPGRPWTEAEHAEADVREHGEP